VIDTIFGLRTQFYHEMWQKNSNWTA